MEQPTLFDSSIRPIQKNQDSPCSEKIADIVHPCPSYKARTFYTVPQLSGTHEERKKKNKEALESSDPVFVYQNYTGIGGLHGIEFKDFGNFHDYTQAKQEFEMGQFFTPSETAKLIVEMLEIEPKKKVADLCCGSGQYFNHLKECDVYGVEIDEDAYRVAQKLYPHAKLECGDIRYMNAIHQQDYMVGNPPFNLLWENDRNPLRSDNNQLLSQDYFIYKCNIYLKDGGFLAFICSSTYLLDELRSGKVKAFIDEHFVQIFEVSLPNTLFQDVGVKNFATKIMGFQKKIPDQNLEYSLFTTAYDNALANWRNSKTYLQFHENKLDAFRYQTAQKYKYYFIERAADDKEMELERQYRKLLYELKRVKPNLAQKAEDQRKEISTAQKPVNMPWEEWEQQKPTLKKLIQKMRRWVSPKEPKDLIRLVKSKSQIKLKGYSRAAIQTLNSLVPVSSWNIHKLVNNEYWNEEWRSFQETIKKLSEMAARDIYYRTKEKSIPIKYQNFSAQTFLKRKQQKFKRLRADISSFPVSPYLKMRLERMQLGDKRLLPHQIEDVGKAIQKPSALLNWEMGTGKTLAAIAWSRMKRGKTLVVAPSLLIRKTWQEELKSVGEMNYQIIEKMSDLYACDGKNYVLISLERIPKYYKRIKEIRFKNLVVDESDNIKNKSGQRTKALKAAARKIRNKLILTGTFTRNNAVEAYPQIELLLNNTTAMLCEVPQIQEYDHSTKEFEYKPNPIYQLPYPAFGGSAIFRKNFSPKKTTVFGASKTNQELYNKTSLDRLLKCVRLRRRFEEVKPKGVTYNIQQVTVPMNSGEVKVYNYIFEEFVRVMLEMYEKDRDAKVAKMLVIMRQIMALLQGASHPWTFPQYDGPEITSKMEKVIEIIQTNPDKKVMFGTPWKPTARKYAEILSRQFKTIYLESEVSIERRNQLIQEFRKGDYQVLISTIGVLKAGINLPEAQIVITDSYPWNYAQLSQYFFRAIRINSKNHTQVYCLSGEGSFDTNVFSLMLAKERVNKFISDSKEVEMKDIASNFGVNEDILKCAIQMVKEKTDGKTCSKITWGESLISDAAARAEE